jgi:predicted Zn-dependent peptidase
MSVQRRPLWILIASVVFLIFFSARVLAQKGFGFPITHYKLKNGLAVILSEDYSLPLVSVVVTYNVGSINEQPGKTGLAYLMENLMFSGSANVSQLQHINFINRVGGRLNAIASEDKTVFYQTVPSNQLALVLWLESDRMKFLEIIETNFEQARGALLDESRQRKIGEPYFESLFSFDQLLYSEFAYSHPLLGTEEDLRNLSLDDVKNFYATYYIPNNAVLCITGHFNKQKAKELVLRYFDTIARGKEVMSSSEPLVYTKRQIVKNVEDTLAQAPAFHLGFRIAPPHTNDFYTLVILDYILLRGHSSRITRRLLNRDNKIAYQLSGGIEKRGDRAVYKIFGVANNLLMVDRCQNAIFAELAKLKTSFISDVELAKFKNILKGDFLKRWATNLDKALFLSEEYFWLKNLDTVFLEVEKYLNVTPTDIVGIANRYFTPENSVILNVKTK